MFVLQIKVTSLCMCVAISATVSLFCLFAPKVYIVVFQPHKNVRQTTGTTSFNVSSGAGKMARPFYGGAPAADLFPVQNGSALRQAEEEGRSLRENPDGQVEVVNAFHDSMEDLSCDDLPQPHPLQPQQDRADDPGYGVERQVRGSPPLVGSSPEPGWMVTSLTQPSSSLDSGGEDGGSACHKAEGSSLKEEGEGGAPRVPPPLYSSLVSVHSADRADGVPGRVRGSGSFVAPPDNRVTAALLHRPAAGGDTSLRLDTASRLSDSHLNRRHANTGSLTRFPTTTFGSCDNNNRSLLDDP